MPCKHIPISYHAAGFESLIKYSLSLMQPVLYGFLAIIPPTRFALLSHVHSRFYSSCSAHPLSSPSLLHTMLQRDLSVKCARYHLG